MNNKKLWVLLLMSIGFLSACHGGKHGDLIVIDHADPSGSSVAGDIAGQGYDGANGQGRGADQGDDVHVSGAKQDYMMSSDAWRDPDSPLAKRKVYFAYDSSEINADGQAVIALHAEYLVRHRAMKVNLEGHTDERGSREYNVSLGERRAQAVRRLLELHGVNADQLTLTSYGEEKPDLDGHDDEAWYFNRRVEISYQE
ncbi:MAG: peptidoglycan-associated lipoprotein Pal [Gammaproteobacteria bacterium]|nr:peptidoglycan-associated lipoprotein Pal [Gammaproteobacteria bacterium]